MLMVIGFLGVPLQQLEINYFDKDTGPFAWIYLTRNLLGETLVYGGLVYAIYSRYADNWYIIEDLALPQDMCNMSHMFSSFRHELSDMDRAEYKFLDTSDIMSGRHRIAFSQGSQ